MNRTRNLQTIADAAPRQAWRSTFLRAPESFAERRAMVLAQRRATLVPEWLAEALFIVVMSLGLAAPLLVAHGAFDGMLLYPKDMRFLLVCVVPTVIPRAVESHRNLGRSTMFDFDGSLELLRIVLAMDDYREAHGGFPDRLGDLEPDYLAAVRRHRMQGPVELQYRGNGHEAELA